MKILRRWWAVLPVLLMLGVYLFSLPGELFSDPTCTVVEDRDGMLLGARIASDGQWRFPASEAVPHRLKTALITFEDRHFYWHPGFNPVSMAKAMLYNLQSGKVRRGGSTITMQVIRLSRKGKPRTIYEKIVETILATRLELRCSKEEILLLYAANAPFGGNVVGLEAASWRYFSRPPEELSWAESATLAVLPNAPSLIFPGRNQETLLTKRDKLLYTLHSRGHFDLLSYELYKMEPLPGRPHPLPQDASHLTDRFAQTHTGKRVTTTLDNHLQRRAEAIVNEYSRMYRSNEVYNAAAIIIEVATGNVLAYVGNSASMGSVDHGHQVDIITAPRSTGSILKPVLYTLMMQEGLLLPNTLVPDIPTQIAGYSPKNYFLTYDGAVSARRSLSRSLNVPSVRMLRAYGVEKFHYNLQAAGLTTLYYPPGHYGLSIILGGAEGTLWDISGMYASMSRTLALQGSHTSLPGMLPAIREPSLVAAESPGLAYLVSNKPIFDAAAIWLTYDALVEVNRPDADAAWEVYETPGKLAWKTGTSFGGRDAWAIGTNRDYVVGVWVGNATGEGRPGLTGLGMAAPVMLDLFGLLPRAEWFVQPHEGLVETVVCSPSGHRAGAYCEAKEIVWIHENGLQTDACPYHVQVHLDKTESYRVNSLCEDLSSIVTKSWFVLPPAMEWFYKSIHPSYQVLPPYRTDCLGSEDIAVMEILYPAESNVLFIPRELDGSRGMVVFEVVHRNPSTRLFWHLDDDYLGETIHMHKMALSPKKGVHTLTIVDARGQTLVRVFEVAY